MDPSTVTLIIGVLTFIGGAMSWLNARRLAKSQSGAADADAITKFTDSLKKLQDRNDELYQENVTLQRANVECQRHVEQMQDRLKERDAQLTSATQQLDTMRDLAKRVPINETLKEQLGQMNTIIVNLQASQTEMTQLMARREEVTRQLLESNRIPPLKSGAAQ